MKQHTKILLGALAGYAGLSFIPTLSTLDAISAMTANVGIFVSLFVCGFFLVSALYR